VHIKINKLFIFGKKTITTNNSTQTLRHTFGYPKNKEEGNSLHLFPSQFISIDAFSHQKQLNSNKERGKFHKALHSQNKSLIFIEYEFLHHKLNNLMT
jgi:hypothetical protein